MSHIPDKIRKELREYAYELMKMQAAFGAWGAENPELIGSVITCQAAEFLSGFRDEATTRCAKKAAEWLTRPAVALSEYSYWRFTSLYSIGVSKVALDEAIDHLRVKVESGINHHENSPLQEFYVKCQITYLNTIDDISARLMDNWLNEMAVPSSTMSADKLAFRLNVLCLAKFKLDEKLMVKVLMRIESMGAKKDTGRHWNSLVATAYTVANIAEIESRLNQGVPSKEICRKLLDEGVRFLCKKWDQKDFASEPLAGGDFDNTHYSKIVVARVLSKVLDLSDPRWRESLVLNVGESLVLSNNGATTVPHRAIDQQKLSSNNPWLSGGFYLIAICIIFILVAIVAIQYSVAVAIFVATMTILLFIVIAASQLRNDERLKDASYFKLISLVIDKFISLRDREDKS